MEPLTYDELIVKLNYCITLCETLLEIVQKEGKD